VLHESQNNFCLISKTNLKLCNDISAYCNSYQIEFNDELKELEDLMKHFKKYLEQF
jgi:hypothetical protein